MAASLDLSAARQSASVLLVGSGRLVEAARQVLTDAGVATIEQTDAASMDLSVLDGHFSVFVDAGDDVALQFALADAAVRAERPVVRASSVGPAVQLSVQAAEGRPCLRCLVPEAPQEQRTRARSSALETAARTVAGGLAAAEVLKIIDDSADERPLYGQLVHLDLRDGSTRRIPVSASPDCTLCA